MRFTDYLKGYLTENRCEMHKRNADRKEHERQLRIRKLHEHNARCKSLRNRIYEDDDSDLIPAEDNPALMASEEKTEKYENMFRKFINRYKRDLQEAEEFNPYDDDETSMRDNISVDMGRSVVKGAYKLIPVSVEFINWVNQNKAFKSLMENENNGICGIYATSRVDKESLWGISLCSEGNSILCGNFSRDENKSADYKEHIIIKGVNFLSFVFKNKINNIYFLVNTVKGGDVIVNDYFNKFNDNRKSIRKMNYDYAKVANKLATRSIRRRRS